MRKDHQSTGSRHLFDLTIDNRSLVLVFIFCFAGSAAGSCLSYGHSCWGAHGKRSQPNQSVEQQRRVDNNPDGRLTVQVEADGNAPTLNSQGGWFLTRLITGRLTVPASASNTGELRTGNEWHGTQKNIVMPGNGNNGYFTRNEISPNEESNIDVERDEDSKEYNGDLSQKIDEPFVATDVFIIPSGRGYNNRPSLGQGH